MSEPRNGGGQRGGLRIGWFVCERRTPRPVVDYLKEAANPGGGGQSLQRQQGPKMSKHQDENRRNGKYTE